MVEWCKATPRADLLGVGQRASKLGPLFLSFSLTLFPLVVRFGVGTSFVGFGYLGGDDSLFGSNGLTGTTLVRHRLLAVALGGIFTLGRLCSLRGSLALRRFLLGRRGLGLFDVVFLRYVWPPRLHLTGQVDRGLNLTRCRLPSRPATLLCLEALERLLETLFRGVVSRSHLDYVHDRGCRVWVSSCVEQDLDYVDPVHRRGESQRRLSPRAFRDVHVRAVLDELRHDPHVPCTGREMKRSRPAVRGDGLRIASRLEEHLDHVGFALSGRDMERGVAADPCARVQPGARIDEDLRQLGVAEAGCPVQGRHPIALGLVHICSTPEQGADFLDIAAHGGVGHRCVRHGRFSGIHGPE